MECLKIIALSPEDNIFLLNPIKILKAKGFCQHAHKTVWKSFVSKVGSFML